MKPTVKPTTLALALLCPSVAWAQPASVTSSDTCLGPSQVEDRYRLSDHVDGQYLRWCIPTPVTAYHHIEWQYQTPGTGGWLDDATNQRTVDYWFNGPPDWSWVQVRARVCDSETNCGAWSPTTGRVWVFPRLDVDNSGSVGIQDFTALCSDTGLVRRVFGRRVMTGEYVNP